LAAMMLLHSKGRFWSGINQGDAMQIRRTFLTLLVIIASLASAKRAMTEDFPVRPVHIVVGYPPGGVGDIVARILGQWLSERLRQPFVIENRPGAASNIATEAVVRAPADGYTLLVVNPVNATSAALYDRLSFNFIRDIAPVAGILRVPNVMEVNPSVPANTVPEFIAYAKANPGKVNYASAGNGTTVHLAGELFKGTTGVNMVHVPYRGSAPALTDLLGGQMHLMFDTLPSSIEHIRTGKLRALAVTTAMRSPALPDTPTVAESVPGFEASVWQGLGAPKNTPPAIVERLNKEINAALADPKVRAQLANLGGAVLALSPAEFGALIAEETEKWARVIRAANIKAE
jgi:tripartite-type tricarboxylate transporter receptor subunit TctC